jgi:hypothetical protein
VGQVVEQFAASKAAVLRGCIEIKTVMDMDLRGGYT